MNKFGLINISSGGFFSNFFVSISTAMINCNDLIPFVELNNTVFSKYCDQKNINTWNWWFDQSIPDIGDVIIKIDKNEDGFVNFPIPFGNISWNDNKIYNSRSYFNKYFKIKEHILLKTNIYYAELFKNKITLGIMARGTEYNIIHPVYGNQTVYTYIEATKKILNENPKIDNIFLVTEDSEYIKEFELEFNNVIYLDVFRRTYQPLEYCKQNWLWAYENNPRIDHTKILGDECMYQALLLGKCDYLLCKKNGTSAAAIFFNDNLKNVYYV